MAESKANRNNNSGGISLPPRLVGQFILWGMMMLVGWSLYTTHTHGKLLAVIEQRLTHIEEEIKIIKEK